MKKTLMGYIFGFLVVGYIGLSVFLITKQGVEELLICADQGGLKIPFSQALCRNYFFNFRGHKQDIDVLNRGVGASFVVQSESSVTEREQILKFLIGKGLDVNHIDMHQLTPLHGAVLANSAEEIEMLLRNGARVNMKDKKFGLTPLELALKLQSESKFPRDRQAVISLLKNAK